VLVLMLSVDWFIGRRALGKRIGNCVIIAG
jgi:hypothetical protein